MDGVVNPIIGTLTEIDHKIQNMIKNTQPGHEYWDPTLTASYPLKKRDTPPYLTPREYLPVMKELKGGFSSNLLHLLVRKLDGSLIPVNGYLVKYYGDQQFQWFNKTRINGVIGWKAFY